MEQAPHVDEITAANMRRLRMASGRGWTQEAFAREVQERLGLEWTRDLVAAIERGQRRLTVGEVLALAHVFGVDPDALLSTEAVSGDGWMWLTPGLRAKGVDAFCRGQGLEETEAPIDREIAPALERARAEARPDTQAEQKAARALETSTALIRATARRLWGCSLDEKRDRVVHERQERELAEGGPQLTQRGTQTLRGHVARELYAELLAARAKPAGAKEPTKGSRRSSREMPSRKPHRK